MHCRYPTTSPTCWRWTPTAPWRRWSSARWRRCPRRSAFTRMRPAGSYRGTRPSRSHAMIKWAIIFAIIGLVAGLLGFTGLAGAAMGIAKFLFWAAVIIAIILFVLGMTVYKKLT